MTTTEVWDLQSDVRGLRTDVDNLLAMLEQQRRELADLRQYCRVLRDRVDSHEMAGVA